MKRKQTQNLLAMNNGRSSTGLLRVVFYILFAFAILSNDALAQNGYQQDPPRKKSALEKLSDLNQRVKRSIKESIFGSDDPLPSGNQYQQGQRSYPQQRQPASNQYERYPRQDAIPPRRPIATQAQYEQELELPPAPPEYDNQTRPNYAAQRQMNPQDYRQSDYPPMNTQRPQVDQYENGQQYAPRHPQQQPMQNAPAHARPMGEHYGARSGQAAPTAPQQNWNGAMAPAPMQQYPVAAQQLPQERAATPGQEYRSGHYQNNAGLTQQEFDQQETATQKLMRLYAENQSLLENHRSMTAENKRLREQLQGKIQLLSEIEVAIEAARKELQLADQQNLQLKKKIVQLEDENETQLLSSNRQLNAIRKKLDDVLMLEMTSNK